MKKLMVWVVVLAAMFLPMLHAQTAGPAATVTHAPGDIAGDWQGTVNPGKETRVVVRIAKSDKGWSGKMILLLDQGGQPVDLSAVALSGSTLRFSAAFLSATFEGTVSADGNSIAGRFDGPKPMTTTLVRATKETAWEIPAPPAPPKLMAADADPSFDVATIKPNGSGEANLRQLTMNGRNFVLRNGSLGDLIGFAYDVQTKQIVNAPDWMDKDRYDIDGVPDKEGTPSTQQLRVMMRKLLADRFALKFHREKKDLPAFVLAVGKNGQKLAPTQLNGPVPGFGMRSGAGGLTVNVTNATMEEFASFLHMLVLDRPVLNQTELMGRFDFKVTFTPDDSQFNGHAPKLPPGADGAESAPNLFDAIQQQIGLKLSSEKTAVDVIAIDHVEKPSPN